MIWSKKKIEDVPKVQTADAIGQERERCNQLSKICTDAVMLSTFIDNGTTVADAAVVILADANDPNKVAAPKAQIVPEGYIVISEEQLKIEKIKAANDAIDETNEGVLWAAEATLQQERDNANNANVNIDKATAQVKEYLDRGGR